MRPPRNESAASSEWLPRRWPTGGAEPDGVDDNDASALESISSTMAALRLERETEPGVAAEVQAEEAPAAEAHDIPVAVSAWAVSVTTAESGAAGTFLPRTRDDNVDDAPDADEEDDEDGAVLRKVAVVCGMGGRSACSIALRDGDDMTSMGFDMDARVATLGDDNVGKECTEGEAASVATEVDNNLELARFFDDGDETSTDEEGVESMPRLTSAAILVTTAISSAVTPCATASATSAICIDDAGVSC